MPKKIKAKMLETPFRVIRNLFPSKVPLLGPDRKVIGEGTVTETADGLYMTAVIFDEVTQEQLNNAKIHSISLVSDKEFSTGHIIKEKTDG